MQLNGKHIKRRKDRIRTIAFREIRSSFARFLSLLIMSLLGVFCFSGLQATAPDMRASLDRYLDSQSLYDLQVTSTLGLTQNDVCAIRTLDGVEKAVGANQVDLLVPTNDNDIVVRLFSDTSENTEAESEESGINRLMIVDGRLPDKKGEIVVEESLLSYADLAIGDVLLYAKQDRIQDELTIVGTVKSPMFFEFSDIKHDHGKTTLGTGTVNFYAYAADEVFPDDYYTQIYVTVEGAKAEETGSDAYRSTVDAVKEKLESIRRERETARYEELYHQLYDEEHEAYFTEPTWTIRDRMDNRTYTDFFDDAESIRNLSKIFPVVFFAVAILISLISMNRMVEDDRGQIGILKSLGYRNGQIIRKYLQFSMMAVGIGGALGAILGTILIPMLIWNIYRILFSIPTLVFLPNWQTTLIGLGLSFLCICGTTFFTAAKVIRETPAELMRPKAPPAGKRVILEKLSFIWKHLSFSRKIIVRNIFRYKKRVLVTVGGIMGCTALMLCGFGLRDAIVDIPIKQFEEIFCYDEMFYVDPKASEEELEVAFAEDRIKDTVLVDMISADAKNAREGEAFSVTLFVPQTCSGLDNVLKLYDKKTKEPLSLKNESVFISDKLAQLMNLSQGDTVSVQDLDENSYSFTIDAVTENYVSHYIFVGPDAFFEAGGEYENNVCLSNLSLEGCTKEQTEEIQKNVKRRILESDAVISANAVTDFISNVEDMLNSLNNVVLILIVLAAMLSFVVLYNLSAINIHERRREIATLKVLGFYDREVDQYITKENILLTLIGVFLGLIAGYFLTEVVVQTVEVEFVRFVYRIKPMSYVYSALIAILFTYIVNGITHFTLKKIDMIESLKSVE